MKHKAGKLECDICQKVFGDKKNLDEHRLVHTDVPNKEAGKSVSDMETEMDITTDNQEEITSETGKKGRPKKSKDQMKIFPCDQCEKSYKRKDHLVRHKLYHSGDRPHVCPVCQKAFIRKDKLTRHEWTHGVNFECNVCLRKFLREETLEKHKVSHK